MPTQTRTEVLKFWHGMRPEQWHAMWEEQDGKCYLGGHPLPSDVRKVVIDHDHSCCPPKRSCRFCRRGLACHKCNTAIGLFNDDPAVLRLVADRLEHAQALTNALLLTKPEQGDLMQIAAGDGHD